MKEIDFKRYEYIDSLRGLAVIGVLIVHVANSLQLDGALLNSLLSSGARGVQLFYLVSALTIFMSLMWRSEANRVSWRNFFSRRFFRIAPMFYLVAIYFFFTDGHSARYFAPDGLDWWTVPLTFTFMHGWHPETINSLVPGGWSIAVEVTFYMLVPVLFVMLKSLRKAVFISLGAYCLMLALNAFMSSHIESLYPEDQQYLSAHFFSFWFFSQLPVFLLGIVCYHLLQTIDKPNKLISLLYLSLFVATFYLFAFEVVQIKYVPMHIGCGVSFLFLVMGLHHHPWQVIVNKLMAGIGKVSFSIYLLHFIVIKRTAHILVPELSEFGNWSFLIYFTFVFVVTTVFSCITYKYIEKPFILLGKRLRVSEFSFRELGALFRS